MVRAACYTLFPESYAITYWSHRYVSGLAPSSSADEVLVTVKLPEFIILLNLSFGALCSW